MLIKFVGNCGICEVYIGFIYSFFILIFSIKIILNFIFCIFKC